MVRFCGLVHVETYENEGTKMGIPVHWIITGECFSPGMSMLTAEVIRSSA
jgi:hypothetical protein